MIYDQGEADFNESTYGMYLTYEIQKWLYIQGDLDGIALQPTLRDEADLGYDTAIPRSWGMLYLQFKMPRYIRRSNGNEYGTFREPYFRFSVKTDITSNGKIQHNLLFELESRGESVFYAAPAFLTIDEITQYAWNDGMYTNSVFPRPSDLGRVDPGSKHCFAYTSGRKVHAFSEPGPELARSYESIFTVIPTIVTESIPTNLETFLRRTLTTLTEVTETTLPPNLGLLQSVQLACSSIGILPLLISSQNGEQSHPKED